MYILMLNTHFHLFSNVAENITLKQFPEIILKFVSEFTYSCLIQIFTSFIVPEKNITLNQF